MFEQLFWAHHMCFDRLILAVESRDLSQADKSVIRVSSFSVLQNFNFWTIKFIVILKQLFGTWQFGVLVNFIIKKKKQTLISVFLVRDKPERIEKIYFAESSGLSGWATEKEVLPSLILGKNTLLSYSCQLQIDHVTQQPKETCQRTCRGP